MEAEEPVRDANDKAFVRGIRDIVMYIVFLSMFTVVVGSTGTSEAYPYSNYLKKNVFKKEDTDFEEIVNTDDMWEYLTGPFVDALYAKDGESNRAGYVLQVDKLIGAVRLQQSRVPIKKSCSVPVVYQYSIDVCYPALGSEHDDTPYGGSCEAATLSRNNTDPPCPDSFMSDVSILGYPIFKYDLAINLTHDQAIAEITTLQDNHWVDLQTREVRAIFTVYNPGVDLFNNVVLIMQPRFTGGVKVSANFRPFYLMRHMLILTSLNEDFPASNADGLLLFIEIIFYLLATIQWFQCLHLLYRLKPIKFFSSFWNVLDIVNLTLFIVVMIFRCIMVGTLVNQRYAPPDNVYEDFYLTAAGIQLTQNIISVACVLSYVKLLRYLQLSPRLSQLTLTISAAAPDLGGFMIIFIVVFCAFAQAFYIAFGMDVDDFHSFFDAFSSLFLLILGEFDFATLRENNPVLGPVLFFSFVIFVFFILVNMFIAILSEAHASVVERADMESDAFITEMREGWRRRVRALSKRRYQGSETVEELARTLKEAQDAVIDAPPGDGKDSGDGAASPSSSTPNLSRRQSREDVAAAKFREATTKTLLQALEYGRDDDESSQVVQKERAAAGLRTPREPVLGLPTQLVDLLKARVDQIEMEQQQTAEWLTANHASVQEKIALLTEATFAITNLVATGPPVTPPAGDSRGGGGGEKDGKGGGGGGMNGGANGHTNGGANGHTNGSSHHAGNAGAGASAGAGGGAGAGSSEREAQRNALETKRASAELALSAALTGVATAKGVSNRPRVGTTTSSVGSASVVSETSSVKQFRV